MKAPILSAALLLAATAASANNVTVSGVGLTGQDASANTQQITFNVGWENSWRTSTNESNYDGAWIIVKFRKVNTSLWRHATLSYNAAGATASGHVTPAGSTVVGTPDGKGVFIHRAANGQGAVNYTGGQLRWLYGVDSLNDNDSVEIRLFTTEMVYCTPGAFFIGSGGSGVETGPFRVANTNTPYQVVSEGLIPMGTTGNVLNYTSINNSTNFTGDALGPIPAPFPKGFAAFWTMKYEVSVQQYADFLNTLDASSAATRLTGPISGTPNAYNPSGVAGSRAMNTVGDEDVLAFLDWAALRPMTELEFEKACRGYNNPPVPNEYAWGNTTLNALGLAQLIYPNTDSERNTVVANVMYGSPSSGRPVRTGLFAHDTTTSRTSSGGTYYGAMEMSGNVDEVCVSAGSPSGRAFTGLHGDGTLSGTATANVAGWSNAMLGYRGGNWSAGAGLLAVSDRRYAATAGITRLAVTGMRGARTAP